MMIFYSVKKLIRHTNDKKWDTVALYDQNNNFRGEAVFRSRKEAEGYIKFFNMRVNSRLNVYGKAKSSTSLRVFGVEVVRDEG